MADDKWSELVARSKEVTDKTEPPPSGFSVFYLVICIIIIGFIIIFFYSMRTPPDIIKPSDVIPVPPSVPGSKDAITVEIVPIPVPGTVPTTTPAASPVPAAPVATPAAATTVAPIPTPASIEPPRVNVYGAAPIIY